jgi:hypothetical protein
MLHGKPYSPTNPSWPPKIIDIGRHAMIDASASTSSPYTAALPSRSGRVFIASVLLAALLIALTAGSTESRTTRNTEAVHAPRPAEQTHIRERSGAAALPALPGANRPAAATAE